MSSDSRIGLYSSPERTSKGGHSSTEQIPQPIIDQRTIQERGGQSPQQTGVSHGAPDTNHLTDGRALCSRKALFCRRLFRCNVKGPYKCVATRGELYGPAPRRYVTGFPLTPHLAYHSHQLLKFSNSCKSETQQHLQLSNFCNSATAITQQLLQVRNSATPATKQLLQLSNSCKSATPATQRLLRVSNSATPATKQHLQLSNSYNPATPACQKLSNTCN
ncbi:hypothetical protein J6590_078942 [Homalodisca vitripennis]|nr:hypothetical protein J6590_078942 [Homalodisca vitripennis]